MKKRTLTLFTIVIGIFFASVLTGCILDDNQSAHYPEYTVTDNTELGCIELSYEGVTYRPFGVIDRKFRGTQIGIRPKDREDASDQIICEVKGYGSAEWIIDYLDVFMGGGDMLYKAVGVTEIPAELEEYRESEYDWE